MEQNEINYTLLRCYSVIPGSSSPRNIMASLLPVKTNKLLVKALRQEHTALLIGSLGWKSTAVTVPLWPGS